MTQSQAGILDKLPRHARYLSFSIKHDTDPHKLLEIIPELIDSRVCVLGLGQPLISALGAEISGLSIFPALSADSFAIPSTQSAMWCWLRGEDRGELLHQSLQLEAELESMFEVDDVVDAFQYRDSRDLTGYEDGTENPKGDDATKVAIVNGSGQGLDGSSFVAVQQWVHDLSYFQSLEQADKDNIVGRRLSDNEEFDQAPNSAHVKRTAQESFAPEAFIVRRSMPWCDANGQGLMFVAFGDSHTAFEAQLNRMLGKEDGIVDGLFRFTRPITGSYYWCPPVRNGIIDLSALEK